MNISHNKRILNLEATLEAAQLGKKKKMMKNALILSVSKLAKTLRLDADEILFCFVSPHTGPRDIRAPRPYGFNFVIPKPGQQFDPYSVKAVYWIERRGKITHKATCTTFYTVSGWGYIADDDSMPPDWVANELAAHLRKGREMPYCIGAPRDYIDEQIIPLLDKVAA